MFMSKNPQAHPSVSTKGTARRAVKQAIVIHSSSPPPYMSGKVFGTPSCLIDLHSPSRRIMYCTVCIQTSKQASKVQRPSKAQGSRISHRSSENQRQKKASAQRSYAHTPAVAHSALDTINDLKKTLHTNLLVVGMRMLTRHRCFVYCIGCAALYHDTFAAQLRDCYNPPQVTILFG